MKYYIDTEFLEGTQKTRVLETLKPLKLHITLFVLIFITIGFLNYSMIPFLVILLAIIYNFISFKRNEKPTIDLISIGIVAEDGREYYAISKDFNLKEAWNRHEWKHVLGDEARKEYWIRENVLKPIFDELLEKEAHENCASHKLRKRIYKDKYSFTFENFKSFIQKYGKTNKEIAKEIKEFVLFGKTEKVGDIKYASKISNNPEFYAYYADYEWVAFCWIFGKMMNLPKDFPKYCKDLKQILDECALKERVAVPSMDKYYPKTVEEGISKIKMHPGYPQQENEHSAIHDARWNKKLHEFLNQI